MSHACVHLNYKRNLLKKADGLRKRKHGLISPLTWPIFDGKAVFNERNIHPSGAAKTDDVISIKASNIIITLQIFSNFPPFYILLYKFICYIGY